MRLLAGEVTSSAGVVLKVDGVLDVSTTFIRGALSANGSSTTFFAQYADEFHATPEVEVVVGTLRDNAKRISEVTTETPLTLTAPSLRLTVSDLGGDLG